MRNIGKILYTAVAALCCGSLPFGCTRDDMTPLDERHGVAVQLNVGTNIVDKIDGTPTDAEKAIHSLRVYAFVDGRQAGHYYTDEVTSDPHTFFMDLKLYSDGEQTVDFYVVANEKAMQASGTGAPDPLSSNTTEAQLTNFWFSNLLRPYLAEEGLPMFCDKTPVTLDFTKVKQESPTDPEHAGHVWLDYTDIEFELRRPVAKIGVFAAKPAGETGSLHITRLTMLEQGTRLRNYLMTPTSDMLRNILSGAGDIDIAVIEDEVTKELAADISAEERANPANYTPVMNEPFYPFENPWGNGGSWNIPGGEHKEHVLKVDYAFNGEEPRTGYVYMPKVERNKYYAVCCLIQNDGRISVEYNVADWDEDPEGEYNIEFNYPSYTNPLQPASGQGLNEGEKYDQPTVWYNSDASSDEGCYTFQFNITGPVGQEWNPVLGGALGTSANFEVKVYQVRDGERVYLENPDEYVASPDPYYIRVKALNSDNVDKEVGLGIAYTRDWSQDGSALLLINGLTSDLKWAGSTVAEYVVIRQTDVPTPIKTDKR